MELDHYISQKFCVGLETLMKLCVTKPNFFGDFFWVQLGKCAKNKPKLGFFEFTEKFGHWFYSICSIIKIYIIWIYINLKNEQTELTDFLHSGTGSRKLKEDRNFLGMFSGNRCGQSVGGTLKLTVFEE